MLPGCYKNYRQENRLTLYSVICWTLHVQTEHYKYRDINGERAPDDIAIIVFNPNVWTRHYRLLWYTRNSGSRLWKTSISLLCLLLNYFRTGSKNLPFISTEFMKKIKTCVRVWWSSVRTEENACLPKLKCVSLEFFRKQLHIAKNKKKTGWFLTDKLLLAVS